MTFDDLPNDVRARLRIAALELQAACAMVVAAALYSLGLAAPYAWLYGAQMARVAAQNTPIVVRVRW